VDSLKHFLNKLANTLRILNMVVRIFSLFLIIFSSSNLTVAQEPKYDLPGNKYLSITRFISGSQASFNGFKSDSINVSNRLVPWSEYLGSKQENRTVSPDRMVYEILVAYCYLTPKGERKYYFRAVDAQTGKTLGRKKIGYTKSLISISPIAKKYGQKEDYFRCGRV
jgi:hypothetical protein